MSEVATLGRLARAWGVLPRHVGSDGTVRHASPETLLAVLRALGAPIAGGGDAAAALGLRRRERWERVLPAAIVAWDGHPRAVTLRLPAAVRSHRLDLRVEFEDGTAREQALEPDALRLLGRTRADGRDFAALALGLRGPYPSGQHRLLLRGPGVAAEAALIGAPRRCAPPPQGTRGRAWGGFAPLYGLSSATGWGAGNFTDLGRLAASIAELGGSVIATLPLLAAFLDRPFECSPYRPVSRRMWNEFYLDLEALGARAPDPAALARARQARDVDFRSGMELRRQALAPLVADVFADAGPRRADLERFLTQRPEVEDYARFRAATEHLGRTWPDWPAHLRDGQTPGPGEFDERSRRLHVCAQWLCARQLAAACSRARERGVRLYLDLPLGVHPEGYDAWRDRASFATGISVGAPPDEFFGQGQNWGFAPPHPQAGLAQRSFGAALAHTMPVAGYLRIDHVMALHRLFWIPAGCPADQGVYVRYPAEWSHALLALESTRSGCAVVGEDLGLVPPVVRRAMARHGLLGTSVLYAGGEPTGAACLATHDMPPLAAYWRGLDIDEGERDGRLDPARAAAERDARRAQREALLADLRATGSLRPSRRATGNVLAAGLRRLAASAAPLVIVDLDDLWLSTRRHNVPGTGPERANWRGRARWSLAHLATSKRAQALLGEVDRRRKQAAP